MSQGCDYLVVGGGAAGCVVAARLAADPAKRVVLLEAGGPNRSPLFRIPALGVIVWNARRYNWMFETEPIDSLGGRRLPWLAGRVLGGSSSINGMVYHRGHPAEYDMWRDAGCTGWGAADVLPYFLRQEANSRGAGPWHGGDGPMPTRPAATGLPICDAILAGLAEAGMPIRDDFNTDEDEGLGYFDVNVGKGKRISAADAYLEHPPANLTILTNATATRIVVEGGRAVGVEFLLDGQPDRIDVDGEVIVSCGAVKSPQLLMLSGVGPADELVRYGIPVAVDSPRVGENLQNHVFYRMQFACREPVTVRRLLRPDRAATAIVRYVAFRDGPLAEHFGTMGGTFRTDPALLVPDIKVSITAAIFPAPKRMTPNLYELIPRRHGFSLMTALGKPKSRGRIRLGSADPLQQPLIEPNYFADPADLAVLANGLRRMRDAMRRPPIHRLIETELMPGEVIADTDLEAEIPRHAGNAFHQCGTCAMGSDGDSVVDPELRVRGVAGLRVADASVMPQLVTAAIHAPVLMIGEKAAAHITNDH